MPIFKIPDWGKGLNTDVIPSELEPGYAGVGTANMVFRDGFATKVDGLQATLTTPTVVPYWMTLYPSTLSIITNFYVVYAGTGKVFSDTNQGGGRTEITRNTEGAVISSITSVGTTATLTTATNHGRTTGDTVSVWGAFPTAYNTTAVITVTGVTTFTYTTPTAPGGAATTVGLYSYDGAKSDFTGASTDLWSGAPLNGVLIVNNPINGLYYWGGSTTVPLRKFPATNLCDFAGTFKNYIIQLGITVGGVKRPHSVGWSAAADPGSIPSSFTASATNDAGDIDIPESGGKLIACMPMGDVNVIYKVDARYAQRYVGGNDVFNFTRLPGEDGLLNAHCVVSTPKGHVFMTPSRKVMIHTGGEATDLSTGRVGSQLAGSALVGFNGALFRTSTFLLVNPSQNEVWVCYPSNAMGSSPGCDSVLIWNWKFDTWGTKTIATSAVTHGASGWAGLANNSAMYMGCTVPNIASAVPYGINDFSTVFTSTLARQGLHFDDPETMKALQRSRWHIDGTAGAVATVYHGSQMTSTDATPTYTSGVSYTIDTTNYASQRAAAGRYLALKVTFTPADFANGAFRVRSCELDVSLGGRR